MEYTSYFEEIGRHRSEIIANLTARDEDWNSTRCVNSCSHEHFTVSYVILTMAVAALLENLCLVVAVATWKLCRNCQMSRFLWHLAVADSVISFNFIFYHCRCLSVCPMLYTCDIKFQIEMFFTLVIFVVSNLSSYLLVLAATVDRFIAIRWSLLYCQVVTTRRARVVIFFIWALPLALTTIGLLLMLYWDQRKGYSVLTITMASLCLISAVLVISLNVAVVICAWFTINTDVSRDVSRIRRSERQESQSNCQSKPSLRGLTRQLSNLKLSDLQRQNRKLALTLILFVISFLVSCVPWPITLLLCDEIHSCTIKSSNTYILVLLLLHAVIIPIIHGFRNEEVNTRLKDCLSRLCHRDVTPNT